MANETTMNQGFDVSNVHPSYDGEQLPSISVDSLWKVFGKNPDRALQPENQEKSRADIQQEFDLVVALRDVSFSVSPGETFVVMGLSGCGKSTLIRCLIRLIEATAGTIEIHGDDIARYDEKELRHFRRSRIAMVFQNYGLLPHKNVLDNAAYGLEVRGVSKNERYAKALEILDKVGLSGWENAHQQELSGGMQQRVGLARALAVDPAIMLMDEPFSGLDPLIRRQMREELSALQQEIQKTIVFITHDLDEAVTIGDRIAIMRDGEIIQMGTPKEIITNPADEFVAEFTQGIPKARFMDIASVVTKPKVRCRKTDSVDALRAMMDRAGSNYAIGVGSDRTFLGVICRDQLEQRANNGDGGIERLMNPAIKPVSIDTTLENALPMLSDDDLPLPVVDESNNFLGVATQKDLLKVMASTL